MAKKYWAIVTILVLIVSVNILTQSNYSVSWQKSSFSEVGAEDSASNDEDGKVSGREASDSNAEDKGDAKGDVVSYESRPIMLQKGSYRVTLHYSGNAENDVVAIESKNSYTENNTAGITYHTQDISGSSTGLEFEFSLDDTVRDIRLVIHDTGDDLDIIKADFSHIGRLYTYDHVFMLLLLVLVSVIVYFTVIKRRREQTRARFQRRILMIVFFVAVSLFASYPLFSDFLAHAHDGHFHLIRIQSIADGLADGQFPVRLNPSQFNGKGYIISSMYPDLFILPFAALRLCNVSLLACYQAFVISVNIATALISFYCAKSILRSNFGASIFCVLYTLSLYRIMCIYTRCSTGEYLAMVFLPILLLGIYEVFLRDKNRWYLITVGFVAIIQSHVLSVLLCSIFCILILLVGLPRLIRERQRLYALIKALALAVLLNIWFAIPFLYYYSLGLNISINSINLTPDHMLYAVQLFMNFVPESFKSGATPYSFPQGSISGEMLLAPGLILIVSGFLLLVTVLVGKDLFRNKNLYTLAAFCLAFAGMSLYLCTDLFPWDYAVEMPVLGNLALAIQFPWRFLGPASLFLALGAAIIVPLYLRQSSLQQKTTAFALICLVAIIPPFFHMDGSMQRSVMYSKHDAPITAADLLYLVQGSSDHTTLTALSDEVLANNKSLEVSQYTKSGTRVELSYKGRGLQWLEIPLTYYPGYRITDESGNKLDYVMGDTGQIRVEGIGNEGSIHTRYTGLWFFRVGDLISLITALGCLAYFMKRRVGSPHREIRTRTADRARNRTQTREQDADQMPRIR